jgi:hypothetical protein
MSNSNALDLDINNYTIGELTKFFKLEKNYTTEDLDKKTKAVSLNIIATDDSVYDSSYKYNILTFINTAKNILMAKTQRNYDVKSISYGKDDDRKYSKDNDDKKTETSTSALNPGKIINPLSNHPAMQTQNIPQNTVNGYSTNKQIKNYVFNSVFRDNFYGASGEDAVYTLPVKIFNVTSINLVALQFPNVMFTFSQQNKTNQLIIYEDVTDLAAIVTIEDGNYTIDNFPLVLEQAINEQVIGSFIPPTIDASGNIIDLNRFQVSISPFTNFTTIKNTTYTFAIYFEESLKDVYDTADRNPCLITPIVSKPNVKDPTNRTLYPQIFSSTLGYQIGYRQNGFIGEKIYTSEAQFNSVFSSYIYFTLNDFVNNQCSNTYAILPECVLDSNILAVIPVTGATFNNTFGNNANYINYKKIYTGPVNISKIAINLVNPYGEPLNLHYAEFSFVLQMECLFDNSVVVQPK